MNKRLKSIVCATMATCSLLVVQNSVNIGPIGVDAVSAASETAAPASTAPAKATTTTRSTSNYTSTNSSSYLTIGSIGDDVKTLQSNLNKFGYNLDVDGIFGMLTLAAVKDFQAQNGLVVDGVVGPKTLGKLNEKIAAAPTSTPTTPTTPTTPAPVPTTPAPKPPVDTVSSASIVNNADALQKAMSPASKGGKWIVATTKDITTDKELKLDGQFTNGKLDANTGLKVIQRKIGLYTQDDKHNVTARFTLTAPKLTIVSPNASLEHGNFKGDLYIQAPNFKLINAKIDGNVYFTNQAAKDTFTIADKTGDEKTVITGKQDMKLTEDVVDAVATASVTKQNDVFEKAISKDGKWIIAVLDNLTFDKELTLDGTFNNTKTPPAQQRKLALYAHAADTAHTTDARFILTAPKLTVKSPTASIQHGIFKGDVYVSAPNFSLVDAVVDGNVYFTTAEAQSTFTKDADSTITGTQMLVSDAGKTSIRIGRADYNSHGSGFVVAGVVMAGDKIAAVSMNEYQFMDATKVTAIPNTGKLSPNYKDPNKVLAAKLANVAFYSENMKEEGKATQAWDVNMNGVIKFATGKTIAELTSAIKSNMTTDGKDMDPKVDAVAGATFTSTNGYLKAILAAAQNAANAGISYMADSAELNTLKIGRTDYNAHGSGFAVPIVAMVGDKIAAVSVDEYQFMDKTKIAAPVPNTEKLSANYKDPNKVLGSKLTNVAYYSGNMKEEGKATQAWDVNMNGVQKFASGKTIAELDAAIKGNMTSDGKDKDPKVDAVTGATFTSTNGYLKAILEAASAAK